MEKQRSAISGQQSAKIKAVSLWQPWASLTIPPGHKAKETRGWDTSYRGPLLICASQKRLSRWELFDFLLTLLEYRVLDKVVEFLLPPEVLSEVQGKLCLPEQLYLAVYNHLPYGKAVAICNLTATNPTENLTPEQILTDLPFGDFSPKRFAWDLQDRKAIKEPFPVKGRQRLFEVDLPENLWREITA